MAYTTINDLPIVQVSDLDGNEYIMVTDEDTNISSKFTVDSLTEFVGENFDNTVDQKLNAKVDKIPGKGLSTEDFTTAEKVKLGVLENYTHPSGVTPGTYTKVVVDNLGHVTSGTHPSTLTGYNILDAYTKTEVDTIASTKQDNLVNQVNIKSINENSIVGSGNLEITVGSGGYAANVYLTTLVSSTNPAYNQISYTPEVAETILSVVVNNNEVLMADYIFDGDVRATSIPAGEWAFHFHTRANSSQGTTTLRFEIFKRSSAGVETVLFSKSSNDINNSTFDLSTILVTQPFYSVAETDRIGIKVYANTTRTSNVTVDLAVGDGNAMYFTTPLEIRHNQLRARNDSDAHPISSITGLQTALDNKVDDSEKGSANGVATLNVATLVPTTQLGTGIADGTKVLKGDSTWGSSTGTGNIVFSASPVLTTPNIGVATGTSFNSITGLASVAPLVAGTAAVGTSTLAARQDHVHPVQTAVSGNAGTATTLQTARTITLSGDVTGSVSFNGSSNVNIVSTVADNSHNHTISNVTGLQTALDNKVDDSEKGSANGVATLDANGKVTLTQIPDSVLGQLEYQGVWNFTTLPTATQKGQYWIASVSGNGYDVGDWAVWNGATFDKVDNTDAVVSVAGRTGNVVLTKSDVGLSLVDNTADSSKNVLSATKLTTTRNIALTGDVTGNINFDGSANVSIATTIAANSVALGTDTTGNYVSGVTAGTGVTVSGTAGEGWSPTIAIDSTVATLTGTQTLTNKTLQDSTTFIVDEIDSTKKVQFDVSGISTATTRTMTIPNVNGSLITTGDTGTVTSTMIADGTIVNADINASAAIADTKLATISTSGKVLNSATSATATNTANTIVSRDATGNFAAGTITGALSGNAGTATTLQTARTLTIGSTGKTFDGSANVSWSLAEIGAQAAGSYQPLDTDLTAIAALAGTSGLLKKTAADTWTLDTNSYVTSSGVTSVTGTAPIISSGGATPAISISAATTSSAGSMSAADKTKLDGIATGATANTGTVTSIATTGAITGGTITTTGTISHSTADGYLHVPATGTTNNGKVLTAGATAGSLSWSTIPAVITDHTLLSNIGTNTHAQIDTALTRLANTSGTNTGDQTITLTGDVTGTGTGSFTTTLANSGVTAGTYSKVTVDAKGRVTAGLIPTLEDLPDATFKRSVRVATTANITLSATQTIDGIALVAGDRVLVKNQTTASQNGIYLVASGAWTRVLDADTSSEIASGVVAIDSGTVNGGKLFTTNFKTTDTLGTTSMNWYEVLGDSRIVASTSASTGVLGYNGTTAEAGKFDGGTTTPTGTNRLNYGGYFYPSYLNLTGSADTATAATHYYVETGSDGFVRPKTLANVKAELLASAALTGTPTAPTAATTVSTTQVATTAFATPRTSTTGSSVIPSGTTAQRDATPVNGYIRYNTTLNSFEGYVNGTWGNIGGSSGGATGGGVDKVFYENDKVITTSYTITTGKNAMSAGDITINTGATVTIPNGSRWVIV